MPVTINNNYKEWAVQKKPDIAYKTIEIYLPNVGTTRLVRDQQFSKYFTLPSDAPRNANQSVEFEPVDFTEERPANDDSPFLAMNVTIQALGSDLKRELKKIQKGGLYDGAELIYREFLNDEEVRNITLEISSASITLTGNTISATQENPTFKSVSRRESATDFPGLLNI